MPPIIARLKSYLTFSTGFFVSLIFATSAFGESVPSQGPVTRLALLPTGGLTVNLNIAGGDANWDISSDIFGAPGAMTTNNGAANFALTNLVSGNYTLNFADLRDHGFAIAAMTCSTSSSSGNVSAQSFDITIINGQTVVCSVSATYSGVDAKQGAKELVAARATILLQNQPNVQRRIDRLSGEAIPGNVSAFGASMPANLIPGRFNFSKEKQEFGASLSLLDRLADRDHREFDIWVQGSFGQYDIDGGHGDYGIIHLGIDRIVMENLLLGLQVQLDQFDWKNGLANGEGEGWMVGGYATAKLDHSLYLNLSAMWGRSSNWIDASGGGGKYKFDTDRILLDGSLVGQIDLGDNTILSPRLSAKYIEEALPKFPSTDLGKPKDSTIALGEIGFTPRVHKTFHMDNGLTYQPFAEVSAVYAFGSGADEASTDGIRGRAEAGFTATTQEQVSLSLGIFYDGIGQEDTEIIGANMNVGVRF